MAKKVLIISTSLRGGSNSDILANECAKGAKGIRTALGNLNRLISQFNQIAMEITVLKSWISEKIYELNGVKLELEVKKLGFEE